MAYISGKYTPDWTGQYGVYDFNTIKLWIPDQERYPYSSSDPYKVFITTKDNDNFVRYDVSALSGIEEEIWLTDPLEFKFLENGWAVAAIGFDGPRTGDPAIYQTDTYGKSRFFPEDYSTNAWFDDFHTSPQHDFSYGVRYLKEAASTGVNGLYYLNKNAFIGYAQSTAGQAVLYSCLHDDMAIPGGTGFSGESSRLKGAFITDSQSSFDIFRRDLPIAAEYNIFPDSSAITGTGFASQFTLTDSSITRRAGALSYGFDSPEVRELNADNVGILWYSRGISGLRPFSGAIDTTFTGTDSETSYKYHSSTLKLNPGTETTTLGNHDPWHGAALINRLRDIQGGIWHESYSFWVADPTIAEDYTVGTWDISPDYTFDRSSISDLYSLYSFVFNWATSLVNAQDADQIPDYYADVYGDASIAWVPPVKNYNYYNNVYKRGQNDRTFRWEEVAIPLAFAQSQAVTNYTMPDEYIIQVTPDLGWHDTLGMFGDPTDTVGDNPHLKTIGPFSIENGTLVDNADGSVQYSMSLAEWESVVTKGYDKHLWRAVPFGDGNPAIGGLPQSFSYISLTEQLKFTVDNFVQETKKAIQVITGSKSKRVTITTESRNIESVIIDQTDTTWKATFIIDRSNIKFTIVATDSGGTAVGKHVVDLDYNSFAQEYNHVWNTFDNFAILAGVERLPGESNKKLKGRIIDAYVNKGSASYNGLISSVNRELGMSRYDNAISVSRSTNNGRPIEDTVLIDSNHTRLSVTCQSLVMHNELRSIDKYLGTIDLTYRVKDIISITTKNDAEIPSTDWEITDYFSGSRIKIDDAYKGDVYVSYTYKLDIPYATYPTLAQVVERLNELTSPSGSGIITAILNKKLGGHEKSQYIYSTKMSIGSFAEVRNIGWSRVGLFKISDEEYKWSFADENSMFFNSDFYQFVKELKSQTNIEWGFVIADKDFWDAVDADNYGRDSLPIVFDPSISHYVTAVPIKATGNIKFDPWESYAMGYYYGNSLIKNNGIPREAFRSGVGFRKDCAVSLTVKNVTANQVKINSNAIIVSPKDNTKIDTVDLQDFIVDI